MSLLFAGCSGNDGATGAAGPSGTPGPPGTGGLAKETCAICHGVGRIADVIPMHAKGLPANQGTRTATITSVTFNPDNAVVTFTFTATPSGGAPVADNILLTPSGSDLAYARFTIARLVPGQVYPVPPNRDPDSWFFYGPRSHTKSNQLEGIAPNTYRFTFLDNTVLDPAWAGYTHRVGIEIYGLGVQSVNPTFDFVPNQGAGPYIFAQTRDIVTTAACNECHNPLGYTPSFHGSRRVETKYCGLCHNSNNALAPQSASGAPVSIPFAKLVHGIHTAQDLLIFEGSENVGDFTDVTYPILIENPSPFGVNNPILGVRDVRNCTKCHKGGADSDNWKTRPSIEACGSCHVKVNFATGAGHLGGPQADNSLCATCHPPSGGIAGITEKHFTENVTPNNPTLSAGLDSFEYNITNVTVDTDNVTPVVKFWIKRNGDFLDLLNPADNTIRRPSGYSTASQPSFLVAWTLPQDGISAPADYNNRNSPQLPNLTTANATGNGAGQPPTVNIVGLPATGTPAEYTVKLTTAKYPEGAQMRAVALTGYFTQTVGTDNVGRHTISVVRNVEGDRTRRVVVKSGYVDNITGQPVTNPANFSTAKPVGCMECHEIFEGHGGSRVNNVQVCVICHNPNLSSSGRTVNPDPATINQETVAVLGPDPLKWPEATNMFRSLIHGIHAALVRENDFVFVRNRSNGLYYNWSEVRFPGNLRACTKCHYDDADHPATYNPSNLPAGLLWVTEKITTGNPLETRAEIIAARASMPNLSDLVTSPITSACYYCHDSSTHADHFRLNGADILSTREDVLLPAP
jgi:OmcA/MtrC family decaheme c-type cytochrome